MGENSKIEWTHHTFNSWRGCVKVSPGCQHCYAESLSKRYGHDIWGVDKPRIIASESYWKEPLKWNRDAEQAGERRRVFCASLADVFEDRADLIEPRARLWNLIAATPALDWLLLTKRPENMLRMVPWMASAGTPWANVWLGTTCEDQQRADQRIPHLLRVPAAVRFLSCEPLLGEVDLSFWFWATGPSSAGPWRYPSGRIEYTGRGGGMAMSSKPAEEIHWVIAGGESGKGARPMHPDWARALRDQCVEAGVAFHFKQWGEWAPHNRLPSTSDFGVLSPKGDWYHKHTGWNGRVEDPDTGEAYMLRYGKKHSGRLLDGREWNEFPTPKEAS